MLCYRLPIWCRPNSNQSILKLQVAVIRQGAQEEVDMVINIGMLKVVVLIL